MRSVGILCMVGIAANLSVGFGCQRGRSMDSQIAINSDPTAGPVNSGQLPPEAPSKDAGIDGALTDGRPVSDNEGLVRCVASEEDVLSFLWSLPESHAQSRYARARGESDRNIKAVLEHYPSPGCRIHSKYEPLECDWVLLVRGPLFSARYQIHPTRRQVDRVDALSYADSCNRRRAEVAQWWPKDVDCSDILKHAHENISANGGKCLSE